MRMIDDDDDNDDDDKHELWHPGLTSIGGQLARAHPP